MNVRSDVVLPQVNLLGSTMALSRGGEFRGSHRAFSAWEPTSSLAKYHTAGRTDGALHRTGPHRVRPIGKAGHRVSVCRSCPVAHTRNVIAKHN